MNSKVITISKFQGDIEWDRVKQDGVEIAFSRLGEGASYIDPSFLDNFRHSRSVGLKVGAWHIFRAKSSTPEKQAATIVDMLKQAEFGREDGLAFEVYNQRGDNKYATKEEMSTNLNKLINCILESELSICTSQLYIKTNIDTWKNSVAWELYENSFKKLNIWPEHWRSNPDYPETLYPWGENNWSFWEYTPKGIVKGIDNDVLLSKMNPKMLGK